MPDKQLLEISPARELVFTGPFTDVVTAHMTLKNPTGNPVVFKVKTTAPKQYCVRPNSGLLKAGDSKTVTVMLQPMDGIPADANRHKFMVQSCVSPGDDIPEVESVWKVVDPTELTYSKLMVVFNEKRDSSSGDDLKSNGAAEESFTSTKTTDLGSSYQPKPRSDESGTVASLRKSLETSIDEKQSLEKQVSNLQQEVEGLLKKNRKLQQIQSDGGFAGGNSSTLQMILMAVATLLIGLILGRLI